MKLSACFGVVLAVIAQWPHSAAAVQINIGDIVAPQFDNNGTIVVVHPTTGNRDVFSLYPAIGNGPKESRPMSIAILPSGDFLVTEAFVIHGLYQIDRQTGDRTFLSGDGFNSQGSPPSRGSGAIDHPNTVLRTPGGQIILVNQGGFNYTSGFITRVDLGTGDRTVLSGLGVGQGPDFGLIDGAGDLNGNGHLIVPSSNSIIDVDLTSGLRSVVSGPTHGTGQALASIHDLVVMPNGDIIVADTNFDNGINSLLRIDPNSGNRTLIEAHSLASESYQRIALGTNGHLLASTIHSILDVDQVTGATSIISDNATRGSGQSLFWGDMVQVVPEPTSIQLGSISVLCVACFCLLAKWPRMRTIEA